MTKKNKYCYGWAIWTNWGSGWEKESVYDKSCESYSQVKKDAALNTELQAHRRESQILDG